MNQCQKENRLLLLMGVRKEFELDLTSTSVSHSPGFDFPSIMFPTRNIILSQNKPKI